MTRNGHIFTILAPPRTLALGGMAAHSEAYKATIQRVAYIPSVPLRFRATPVRATRGHDGFPCFCCYLCTASYHRPHARNGVAHSGFQSPRSDVKVVSLCPPGLVRSQRAQEHHAAAPWRPLAAVRNGLKRTRNGHIFNIMAPHPHACVGWHGGAFGYMLAADAHAVAPPAVPKATGAFAKVHCTFPTPLDAHYAMASGAERYAAHVSCDLGCTHADGAMQCLVPTELAAPTTSGNATNSAQWRHAGHGETTATNSRHGAAAWCLLCLVAYIRGLTNQ
jgi:hypothetical protein